MEEDNQNSEVEEEGEDEHRIVSTLGPASRPRFLWNTGQKILGLENPTRLPNCAAYIRISASQTVILHFSPALSALHCSSSSIVFSWPIHCCCGDGVYKRQPLMKGVMKLEVTKFRPREVVRHVLLTATVPLQRILTLEGHVAHDVLVEESWGGRESLQE
ncbi:hypothetical protein Vadar_001805 [Vaccinium darrowii]|uniref:Uncharacterized protein n=1 Tax=Vaccinium darrowii TaxID=229202 RepID=A0ACB7YCI2_9ERIC|nr:hypothetical protein Vadar_001805 [Vaccinium darrowii]